MARPGGLVLRADRLYANGRTAAHRAAGYLVYLALVGGVGLDFAYVLGRRYARLLDPASGAAGYGIDLPLWESHVARLVQLGYPTAAARSHLTWGLGRVDPDPRRPGPDRDHHR